MEIKKSLSIFGLDSKEQDVYLMLTKTGPVTALILSRKCGIKRSSLYRVLERMQGKGLVEVKVDDKTTFYSASSPRQFETFLNIEEERISSMRNVVTTLHTTLSMLASGDGSDISVTVHRGIQGLKYLEWKKTEIPNTELLILGPGDTWWKTLGRSFAEEIRNEHVKKNVHVREILNEGRLEMIPDSGIVEWTDNKEFVLHHFHHRVIDKKIINFTQDIYIMSNTIHYHGYKDGDIVGVEVVSRDHAAMMKGVFEMIWNQAKEIDNFG